MWYSLKKWLLRGVLKVWSGPWYPNVYTMIQSAYLPRAVYVAAELRIADILQQQPRTIDELAELTHTHKRSLFRIMRLLAAYRVFSEDRQGRFHLARLGRTMTSDHPESALWWALSLGDELQASSDCILEAVSTGQTGFKIAHGIPLWEWYPQHAAQHDIFIKGMNGFSRAHCREIIGGYDFSRFGTVVDVGGGGGLLIGEILKHTPGTKGVLFDQPETIVEARQRIAEQNLSDRCQTVGGNFFDGLPAGGDAYIFKHVLRDWDDESVVKILRNCREAIPEQGRLLIIDAIVDPRDNTDRMLKLIDVQLMVDAGGGLRTRAEFDKLLAASGFEIIKVTTTKTLDAHVMEARPIERPAPPESAAPERDLATAGHGGA